MNARFLLATVCTLLFGSMSMALAQGPGDSGAPEGLAGLLRSDSGAVFQKAVEPRRFVFPADHGPHPEYRNEWWYVTGNLDSLNGRRFGFELTIFRFALTPDVHESDSDWRTNQVYVAHFAVTDADSKKFFAAERYSRGAAGLAGATTEPFRVWIDDWSITATGDPKHWRLKAVDASFAIDLDIRALKKPVLNGVAGLSQKSAELGNASYYYSMTRWATEGSVRVDGESFTVSGLSWLDREWSSSAIGRDQQGWDWFALQLDDGSELMFYNLRKSDGSQDVFSAGTWVAADGATRHLTTDDVQIEVVATWDSPAGGTYPAKWRLHFPDIELSLDVEPVVADQELFTIVRYWEGAVDVTGERAGRRLSGRGYVELTGYAD